MTSVTQLSVRGAFSFIPESKKVCDQKQMLVGMLGMYFLFLMVIAVNNAMALLFCQIPPSNLGQVFYPEKLSYSLQ